MADELNSSVSYLMALKHGSEPRPTGTIPQTGQAAEPAATGDRFNGAEKRRSPRYKCEGGVEMREEGCDVHTWATFTDVSLHGCYVEAQATYPVGTILRMKLQANGFAVETKGNVRVNYPYLGMGIAFQEMSEDNQAKLKELLATLAHHTIVLARGTTLPATTPLDSLPVISDPAAAVRALAEFFETRLMMPREDFIRILRKSQPSAPHH